MPDAQAMFWIVGVAFALSFGMSGLLRRLCMRWLVLDQPNGDRWHRVPKPRLGGVAVFAALVLSVFLFVQRPLPQQVYGLLAGAAFTFAWGLIDDLWRLRPAVKLLLLVVTGIIPLMFGLSFPTPWPLWGMIMTAFWVTGITNAINWLDNMDGIAAGVATLAAATLAVLSIVSGNALGAVVALALAGAPLGFLMHNFPPAKIFMGDCGSGVLGYSLAVIALLVASGTEAPFPQPILTAAFVLGVPLLDMIFVATQRVVHGRSIFVGGKDHLAHRLVALGLSEREVYAVLYTLAMATGSVAMLTSVGPSTTRMFAIGAGITLVASVGIIGSLAKVYQRPSVFPSYLGGLRTRYGATMLQGVLLVAGLGLLYSPMLANLFSQWRIDPEDSHGPLIPLVAAYLIWRQRERLQRCPSAPSAYGYPVILLGLALFIVGEAAVVGYVMRVSLLVVLAGLILFLSGPQKLRILGFPLAYLLFMIPLPYIVFDRIALPLQFIASNLATTVLDVVGIPVLRQGNIITLPTTQLGVTEACSGIRSLMALGALSTIYAYLAFPGWWRRVFVVVSTVPIAIGTNAARVAVTGILVDVIGHQAAMGFYHTFSGLLIFGLAAILMVLAGATVSVMTRSVPGKQIHATSV